MNSDSAAYEVRLAEWGDDRFPVDPVTIAKALGVQVLETELPKEVSGAIIKDADDDAQIVVERRDSQKRKRFTIAHELGHYIKNSDKEIFDYVDFRGNTSKQGSNVEEIFANNFAAELLMPKENVKSLFNNYSSIPALSIKALSVKFGVSTDAMRYRLINLGLISSYD